MVVTISVVCAEELVLTTYYPAPNGQYLNMNVAGTLTGAAINVTGPITTTGAVTGSSLSALGANSRISLSRNNVERFVVDNSGSITTNGTISSVGNIITSNGKMYSQQTEVNDPDNTVVTKGFVLSRANIQIVTSTNHCFGGYPYYYGGGPCVVTCPAGKNVVSGGTACGGLVKSSYPSSANSWAGECVSHTWCDLSVVTGGFSCSGNTPTDTTVFAVCM